MSPFLLPIPLIFSQALHFFVTVAVEGFIYQQRLGLSRQKSIKYSVLINLISFGFTWLFTLVILLITTSPVNDVLFAYIFFGNSGHIQLDFLASTELSGIILGLAILYFFGVCYLEFLCFLGLEKMLSQLMVIQGEKDHLFLERTVKQPITQSRDFDEDGEEDEPSGLLGIAGFTLGNLVKLDDFFIPISTIILANLISLTLVVVLHGFSTQ